MDAYADKGYSPTLLGAVPEEIERAYNDVYRKVFWRVKDMLGNFHDAEEVMQDTLISACRKIHTYRRDKSMTTWIYSIAMNAGINRLNLNNRRYRNSSDSIDDFIGIHSGEPTPRARVERRELRNRIDIALGSLPEHHRQVLKLRLESNMSYEQIAGKMHINIGTVRSRIARARQGLMESLNDNVTEYDFLDYIADGVETERWDMQVGHTQDRKSA